MCSMVQTTLANFYLPARNMKFNTKNEERIRIHTIICITSPVCFLYTSCVINNILIIIGEIYKIMQFTT
jgi:diacylglycerol kinase